MVIKFSFQVSSNRLLFDCGLRPSREHSLLLVDLYHVILLCRPDETHDRRAEVFIRCRLRYSKMRKEMIIAITNGYVLGRKKTIDTVVLRMDP